ncbi:MAG: hypothetical protein ABJX82_18415 [Paracoccaceae bacterium]
MIELNRPYTSVEILARENSALAIGRGVAALKTHLETVSDQPAVWRDVHARCKEEQHISLMQWIEGRLPPKNGRERFSKEHSPKHNLAVWMLYQAANLDCPDDPPKRRF